MTSRNKILNAIRAANVPSVAKPSSPSGVKDTSAIAFENSAVINGASVVKVPDKTAIETMLDNLFPNKQVASNISKDHIRIDLNTPLEFISQIEVAVMHSELGVVENGAILVLKDQMQHPALPFLCEHLVLIVSSSRLVANMAEAYEYASNDINDYSVFIAGPSKTADIEQSLVIGAHGPTSLTILLTD